MTRWHFFYPRVKSIIIVLKKCQFKAIGIISDYLHTIKTKLIKILFYGIKYSTFSR